MDSVELRGTEFCLRSLVESPFTELRPTSPVCFRLVIRGYWANPSSINASSAVAHREPFARSDAAQPGQGMSSSVAYDGFAEVSAVGQAASHSSQKTTTRRHVPQRRSPRGPVPQRRQFPIVCIEGATGCLRRDERLTHGLDEEIIPTTLRPNWKRRNQPIALNH